MNKSLSELASKSSLAFAGNLTSKIIGFVFGILVGRLLGASIYGKFSYMVSFLSIFVALSTLGLTNGLIVMIQKFEATRQYEKKQSLVTFSLAVTALLSTAVSLVFFFNLDSISTHLLNRPVDKFLLSAMIPTLPLLALRSLFISALRAQKKIKEMVLISNIVSPLMRLLLLLLLVLIFRIHSVYVLVMGYYVYNLITLLWAAHLIRRDKLIGRFRFNQDHLEILRYSLPMFLSGMVGIVITNVDQYMIGYLISDQQVGIYKVALQFGTFASFGLYAVNTIFAPMISNLFHSGELETLRENYSLSTKWIYIISLLIFGIMLLFGREVLQIVGAEFIPGYWALVFIALGQIVSAMVGSAGYMLSMTGHPEYELYGNLMVMVVNIVLNYFMIQIWGIVGAAIASMLSVALANLYKLQAVYRTLGLHPFDKSFIGIILSSLMSLVILMGIKVFLPEFYLMRLLLGTMLYTLVYLLIIYRFALKSSERNWLIEGFKKVKRR